MNNQQTKPRALVNSPSSSSKLILPVITAIIILIVGIGALYLRKNRSQQKNRVVISPTVVYTPSPTTAFTNSPKEKSFTNGTISFSYPNHYYISSQTDNEVIWKADYTPGTFREDAMVYHKQMTPFSKIAINESIRINASVTRQIVAVSEEQKISLGGIDMVRYAFSCGVDCDYHVIRVNNNNVYHEIIFDGAGGGLRTLFDSLLTTVKVLNTTINGPTIFKGISKYNIKNGSFTIDIPQTCNIVSINSTNSHGYIECTINNEIIKIYPEAGGHDANVEKKDTINLGGIIWDRVYYDEKKESIKVAYGAIVNHTYQLIDVHYTNYGSVVEREVESIISTFKSAED